MPCWRGHAAAPKVPAPCTNTTLCLNISQPYSTVPASQVSSARCRFDRSKRHLALLSWLLLAHELVEALGKVQLGRVEIAALLAEGRAGGQCLGSVGPAGLGLLALLRSLGRVSRLRLLFRRVLGILARTAAGSGQAGHPGHSRHAALCHLLHHLLGLGEALQQAIDLGDVDTGTTGDAGAP